MNSSERYAEYLPILMRWPSFVLMLIYATSLYVGTPVYRMPEEDGTSGKTRCLTPYGFRDYTNPPEFFLDRSPLFGKRRR